MTWWSKTKILDIQQELFYLEVDYHQGTHQKLKLKGKYKNQLKNVYVIYKKNLPYVAHKNEPIDMKKRIENKKFVCSNIKIILHTIKAITIGSRQ